MNEKWKAVIGYCDSYEVSNLGRVRSLLRRVGQKRKLVGGLVLTPIAATTGTTAIGAQKNGCKFIGIEIEPKYFEIACSRIENAQRQQRMFA